MSTNSLSRNRSLIWAVLAIVMALVLALPLAGCSSDSSSDGSSSGSAAEEAATEEEEDEDEDADEDADEEDEESTASTTDDDDSDSGGIYVMTSYVGYMGGSTEDYIYCTVTNDIDENGNILTRTFDYVGDSLDIYDTTYTYTRDENGFYTEVSYTRYSSEEEAQVELVEERDFTETNDDGCPLEIECLTYLDGEEYGEGTDTYTYYDDNTFATIDYSDEYEVTYDEDGYILSYFDYTYTYETDDDGVVTSCTETEDSVDTVYEFTYDEYGNVVTVESSGTTYYKYEITYEYIEEPSLAATIIAKEKSYLVGFSPVVI